MAKSIGHAWPIAILFFGSIILPSATCAHDPSHQYSDWFQKQHNKDGYVCCAGSDAHYLGPDEWANAKGDYRVRIEDIWFDVTDNQMLRPDGSPNPTGNAILWYDLNEFGFSIRCFTPQHES